MIKKEFILDNEEENLIDSINRNEWKSVGPDSLLKMKTDLKKATINSSLKKQITIRLNVQDIRKVKAIAQKEGIPYQTYIGSIIHKSIINN